MVVIGDVHGCFDTLMALLQKVPKDRKVCFVGDLIDRGPKSRQVVEFVKNGGYDCVIGNHEEMFINEALKPRWGGIWIPNGGLETIESYKLHRYSDEEGNDTFPFSYTRIDKKAIEEHIEWMKKLPVYLEYPEVKFPDGRHLVVSHSNVGKFWRWDEKRREQNRRTFETGIIWGRNNFKDNPEIYNVVGHTPVASVPKKRSFYCNIDTGAVFRGDGYGFLTALLVPEMTYIRQKNVDKYEGYKFSGWDSPTYEEDWGEPERDEEI